ncbi:carboxypeptidase-like regulatory domain-containing protein [Halotia branconii]|uniref:Carboxypeptidase-like regulatory domain-containing protein n=1 Tax=Halotia branconii CENA392 TaxID=1539056 RepID=A0AAJ6PBR1_9CYAN|nr:carboxypeptidase-like regulatory domain-containing protein [Halotia branconii]WGV28006.1 carboxypeptidase-like regulatory domain-containing protein [Halotia branconii CENA392]
MATNNGMESKNNSLVSFERNSYFYGKLLTVRDFELEQQYGIEKNHLFNRLVLGKGIVSGLEVGKNLTIEKDNQQDKILLKVQISQGVALDSFGREIVVSQNISETLSVNSRGKNYIYIQYKEQPTERVSQAENGYARIKETYTVFTSAEVPSAQIKGKVYVETDTDSELILGVKVEAIEPQTQIVKAITFTDAAGNYTLIVPNGTYQIKASASGFETQTSPAITVSITQQNESAKTVDLTLIPDSSKTVSLPAQDIVQQYYNDYLRTYSEPNQDTKVLLAVVNIPTDNAPPKLDLQETAKYRQIVYSNTMLYDLISKINTTNITPGDTVGSIQQLSLPGSSSQFARADHAHNLADDVVIASKINPKTFTSSDNSISIAKTKDKQSFDLKVASSVKLPVPGETATSIQPKSNPGTSPQFARADHVHNLQINQIGPDVNGNLILTPGDNINLVPGQKSNELVISTTGDTASTISTGTQELAFETDEALPKGSLVPVSVTVSSLQEGQPFSVILAPILPVDIPPITRPPLEQTQGQSGIHFVFGSNIQLPRMYVAYVPLPYNKTFEIHGFDANLADKEQKVKVVYWVIPGSATVEENQPSTSIKDQALELIKNNADGMTITGLMRELGVARSELEPELAELVEASEIQRVNNRFRISET